MSEQELFNQMLNSPAALKVMAYLFMWRQIAKPVCSLVLKYIEDTPSKKDDRALKKFLNDPKVKALLYIVDMVFSIKLQPKEKKNESNSQ